MLRRVELDIIRDCTHLLTVSQLHALYTFHILDCHAQRPQRDVVGIGTGVTDGRTPLFFLDESRNATKCLVVGSRSPD
jgi:hypothetical protein